MKGINAIPQALRRWEFVIVLMLLAEIAIFGMINPRFLSLGSLLDSTSDFVQIGIVALPLALVVIGGGIDVSFSSAIGLCAIVFGVAHFYGLGIPVSILLALVTGCLCGTFNAAMIVVSRIQPLVITLGSLYLFSGLATVLSGTVGGGGYEGIGGFPDAFTNFASGSVLGIPVPLSILLVEAVVLGILLHTTRFGRMVYLCGLSERAAAYSGLPIDRVRAVTYVLTGLASAVAGIVLSSYFGSARTDLGTTTLLSAVTAVALGGVSVYGGQGTIFGTFVATLLIGYLQQGLQMSGVPSQVSGALSGALLVIVVAARQLGGFIGPLLSIVGTAGTNSQIKGEKLV
jgi:AI-2 transport system permease protein